MKTTVFVKFSVEGLHNFPQAKNIFPTVGFLSDLHRHLFYIECEMLVTHTDRDKEFILEKREIVKYLIAKYYDANLDLLNFGRMSCEEIALDLMTKFDLEFCSVSEDNENGAKCYK